MLKAVGVFWYTGLSLDIIGALSALLAVALVGCKSSQSIQSSSHTSKTEINYSLNIGEKTLLQAPNYFSKKKKAETDLGTTAACLYEEIYKCRTPSRHSYPELILARLIYIHSLLK